MGSIDSLVERNIQRYESRLEHVDDLIEQARNGLQGHPDHEKHAKTLADILARRDELQVRLDDLKLNNPDRLSEELQEDGPIMGIADAIAGELEALLEKLDA